MDALDTINAYSENADGTQSKGRKTSAYWYAHLLRPPTIRLLRALYVPYTPLRVMPGRLTLTVNDKIDFSNPQVCSAKLGRALNALAC